jgi:uncharacterized protein (DUF952 family)
MLVFKICAEIEWARMQKDGVYRGSADDKKDGFIHLSTSAQLAGTLTRHFPNVNGLMLIAIDSDSLGDKLKWEAGSNGETFPHLYHELAMSSVRWTSPIPKKGEGVYALPPQAFASDPRKPAS